MSVEEAVRRGLLVFSPITLGETIPPLTPLMRAWCERWLEPMQT